MISAVYLSEEYKNKNEEVSKFIKNIIDGRVNMSIRLLLDNIYNMYGKWYGADPSNAISLIKNSIGGACVNHLGVDVLTIQALEKQYDKFNNDLVTVSAQLQNIEKLVILKISTSYQCPFCDEQLTICYPFGNVFNGNVKCAKCSKKLYIQSTTLFDNSEFLVCWKVKLEYTPMCGTELYHLNALIPHSVTSQMRGLFMGRSCFFTGILLVDAPTSKKLVKNSQSPTNQYLSAPVVLYVLSVDNERETCTQTTSSSTSIPPVYFDGNKNMPIDCIRDMVSDFGINIKCRCIERFLLLLSLSSAIYTNNVCAEPRFGTIKRLAMHIMFIGPPGEGKTTLLRAIRELYDGIVSIDAATSTSRALVYCSKSKKQQNYSKRSELQASNNRIMCIDELDKNVDVLSAVENAMKYGITSVTKYGIHASFKTSASIVCACNPFNKSKKYDSRGGVVSNLGDNSARFLSLFDIIWPVLPNYMDTKSSKIVVQSASDIHQSSSNICCGNLCTKQTKELHALVSNGDINRSNRNKDRVKAHIQRVLDSSVPLCDTQCRKNIMESYSRICNTHGSVISDTLRSMCSFVRVVYAIARLLLAENINSEHISAAEKLFDVLFCQYSTGIDSARMKTRGKALRLKNVLTLMKNTNKATMSRKEICDVCTQAGFVLSAEHDDVIQTLNNNGYILKSVDGNYRLSV